MLAARSLGCAFSSKRRAVFRRHLRRRNEAGGCRLTPPFFGASALDRLGRPVRRRGQRRWCGRRRGVRFRRDRSAAEFALSSPPASVRTRLPTVSATGLMLNSLNAYEFDYGEGPGTLHALGIFYGTSVAICSTTRRGRNIRSTWCSSGGATGPSGRPERRQSVRHGNLGPRPRGGARRPARACITMLR